MKERRKFVRLPATVRVKYKIISEMESYLQSRTKDIGGGGLKLLLDEKLKENTLLELEIEIPGNVEPIFAKGMVVWIEDVSADEQKLWEIGTQFTEISAVDRDVILKFVYKWLSRV